MRFIINKERLEVTEFIPKKERNLLFLEHQNGTVYIFRICHGKLKLIVHFNKHVENHINQILNKCNKKAPAVTGAE